MKYFFIFILSINAFAGESSRFYDELTSSVGMAMVNYTEDAKTIQGDNVAEAASGTVTSIAATLQYKYAKDFKKSFYFASTFPLISSPTGTYISFSTGIEYYFNDIGAKTGLFNSGTSIQFTPKFRYFAGGEIGGAYLVYTTETSKKSDALFEIGGFGGMAYSMSQDWAIKSTVGVLKGTGAVTSTMTIKFFIGVTFFL